MSVTLATLTIQNPGFETGDLSYWDPSDAYISVVGAQLNNTPRTGSKMVYAGPNPDPNINIVGSRLYADPSNGGGSPWFDVSAYATSIDGGGCQVQNYAAWFLGYNTVAGVHEPDHGALIVGFYDGSGTLISETLTTDPSVWLGTAWVQKTLSAVNVPVGTRRIKLGVRNTRVFGLNNDCNWDDFSSPDLVNTTALIFDAAISFDGTSDLRLSNNADVEMAIAFVGTSRLVLEAQNFPLFQCPAPEAKTWARPTIVAKTWACVTVVPAEECDGLADNDGDLDAVSGDRLVTLDGYGLKLVS